ncbi:MAG: methyltransferase [Candidatus Binatus sp.]|uniref:methyltransferase n=1 Tax=Candidatus Binatus sp. TaxID=2811406 RepID=UPI0027252B07|nr:methyltransferase [Candidatus Binatus sp.]MDO8433590.1 methyltransferase [Candidatus Binatus sp.]
MNDSLLDNSSLREKISNLFVGGIVTQIVYVAAKLGIPDLLASAPMTAEEIAAKTGAHPPTLVGILRALVALEVLGEMPDRRFALKPIGEFLRSNPGWRTQAILLGEEYFRAAGDLLHTALTGEPAFDHIFGMGFYEYFTRNEAAASRFNEVMTMTAPLRYSDVTAAFDFSRAKKLVDIGGGHGAMTSIVLRANSGLRAVLFDSPPVVEGARRRIEVEGLGARCEFVGGDFFKSVPAGGDAYLLSSVMVNWDDERALAILRNCRAAMTVGADLVIAEYAMLEGRNYATSTYVAAVAALAIQGSHARSQADYDTLLAKAGFRIEKITPLLYEPYVLLHARPV